jgi:glycerol-3-phosphate acyltransferase PlsX
MGGDHAPEVVVDGAVMALAENPELQILLTGPDSIVTAAARTYPDQISAVVATEVIAMDDHPAEAIRAKRDSSIVVGCRLVADGEADGFFSAGSTGAVMAAATLIMGRIAGISRPMIATLFPTAAKADGTISRLVFADAGANADVKPEYLLQFAQMGQAYAMAVMGIDSPRVGLLNIGEEATKGNELALQAYQLLSDRLPGFAGNAEGTDILTGRFDVIVTDGFTGNVVLKTFEGTVTMLFSELMGMLVADQSNEAMLNALGALRKHLSADQAGGAPLLGVRGSCFIGHGSSSAQAIANGISATARSVHSNLPDIIARAVTS